MKKNKLLLVFLILLVVAFSVPFVMHHKEDSVTTAKSSEVADSVFYDSQYVANED